MMHFIRELSLQYADENQDSEPCWGPSNMFNKPDYKSFKFIDNTKGGRKSKDCNGVNVLESDRLQSDEMLSRKNVSKTVKSGGSCERRKIYIKKNVVDSFLPEIVGFLDKNNYHFIKDSFGNIEAHRIDCCKLECCETNSMRKCSILTPEGESSGPSLELADERGCRCERDDQNPVEATLQESDTRRGIVREYYSSGLDSQDEQPIMLSSRIATGLVGMTGIDDGDCDEGGFNARNSSCLEMEKQDASDEDDEMGDSHSTSEFQARFSELVASSEPDYGYEQDNEKHDDPLQYRGSLSSRSSTSTSASFAFPILISEWPGTPRRMPRADRRYWRSHHHYWRKNLLCCRF